MALELRAQLHVFEVTPPTSEHARNVVNEMGREEPEPGYAAMDKQHPWVLSKVLPASALEKVPSTPPSKHDPDQDYLLGLRGCLAVMSFLWVFLQTFAPAAVAHSANDTGPESHLGLRKSLSVLFWNDSLIYNSIIFLSARMICLPFLLNLSKIQLASTVLRRGLRLWFPVCTALIVVWIAFSLNLGNQYLYEFADLTGNNSMAKDIYILPTHLTHFNSIFDIFWVTHDFNSQAGNWAFPTQTLWIVSVLFQQSYTVYAAMAIIPYTRKSWRLVGAAFFIITAWWVYSWAWFSITGLLLADLVVDMDLRARCQRHRVFALGTAVVLLAAGFAMQFIWAAARPDLYPSEIYYHTGLYTTGGVYTWNDTTAPQLRADCYLAIVGFHVLLESSSILRKIFANPVFKFLGNRSFSRCLHSNAKRMKLILIRLLPSAVDYRLHPWYQDRHQHDRGLNRRLF